MRLNFFNAFWIHLVVHRITLHVCEHYSLLLKLETARPLLVCNIMQRRSLRWNIKRTAMAQYVIVVTSLIHQYSTRLVIIMFVKVVKYERFVPRVWDLFIPHYSAFMHTNRWGPLRRLSLQLRRLSVLISTPKSRFFSINIENGKRIADFYFIIRSS